MRAIVICTTLLMFITPCVAQQSEADQIKDQTSTLLARQEFSQLNALAEGYRLTGAKTENGIPKLALFYAGMERLPMGDAAREQQWRAILSFAERWVQLAPSPAAYIELAKMHLRYAWEQHGAEEIGRAHV